MGFNAKQIKQLLQPINPRRVLKDGKGNSHVAQQDITAHLNRMFGFGNWDKEVLDVSLVYETPRDDSGKKWDVCYRALVRLTIKDPVGQVICTYTDGSMGVAQNQSHGDAHDLAYKSAISLSTKRAAKDMGDQFGLSLYNKGQMSGIVGATLVGLDEEEVIDVQENVEQVVAMGNDEVDTGPDPADTARDELRDLCETNGWDLAAVAEKFKQDEANNPKAVDLKRAPADLVGAYRVLLETGVVKV